jgi:hypothetical protein
MPTEKEFFCTDAAWAHGVPLIGTATRGDVWFLIEYAGRWGAKAFEESDIPAAVKHHFQAASYPGVEVRTLLIRQPESRHREGFAFFVGQVSPVNPRLYEYYFEDYTDLLKLDIAAFVQGKPGNPNYLREKPLYLVCANGKRDQCCAIYGPETYQEMANSAGEAVWQSSHIGGHNQAPITLFFPHGVNYGHTTPSEARRLVTAYEQGDIGLHHYRGRVCFETPVQAAEHFWREQTGILDISDLRVTEVIETGRNRWAVAISDATGNHANQIYLERRESDLKIQITCSKKKESPIYSFHRLSHIK